MSLGWRSVESRAISWKKKVLKFHSEKKRKGCEKRSNFSFNYSNILFTLHTLPPNAIFAACHETPRKNGRRKKHHNETLCTPREHDVNFSRLDFPSSCLRRTRKFEVSTRRRLVLISSLPSLDCCLL